MGDRFTIAPSVFENDKLPIGEPHPRSTDVSKPTVMELSDISAGRVYHVVTDGDITGEMYMVVYHENLRIFAFFDRWKLPRFARWFIERWFVEGPTYGLIRLLDDFVVEQRLSRQQLLRRMNAYGKRFYDFDEEPD